jgi:hypothetical protein
MGWTYSTHDETKNASGYLICIPVNINIEVYLIKSLCVGELDSSE